MMERLLSQGAGVNCRRKLAGFLPMDRELSWRIALRPVRPLFPGPLLPNVRAIAGCGI